MPICDCSYCRFALVLMQIQTNDSETSVNLPAEMLLYVQNAVTPVLQVKMPCRDQTLLPKTTTDVEYSHLINEFDKQHNNEFLS